MKLDDEHLIEACRRNDQRACKQLYDRFAPQMFGVCLRYTNSQQAAEDVLHDGFIKVFENLKKLKDAKSLASWIRSIMIYTAINSIRGEMPSGYDDVSLLSVNANLYTSEDIYSQLDIHVILDAIQQLPAHYRSAFNLCVIEGFTNEEASRILGIGQTTVRTNLLRARNMLAAKLKPLLK